jgi:hypothetical protein
MLHIPSRFISQTVSHFLDVSESFVWRKTAMAVSGLSFGLFPTLFVTPRTKSFVMASGEDSHIQHVLHEIVEHAIWHHVGHVIHIGGFAIGVLGSLLSSQSLGEKDSIHIPASMSPPRIIRAFNPATNREEDCLVLENGTRIMGRDILRFYQDIQFAKCVQKKR